MGRKLGGWPLVLVMLAGCGLSACGYIGYTNRPDAAEEPALDSPPPPLTEPVADDTFISPFGSGINGELRLGTGQNRVINRYARLAETVPAGALEVVLAEGSDPLVSEGQLLLLWHYGSDAVPTLGNQEAVVAPALGQWEFARADVVDGLRITLMAPLGRAYDVTTTQVVYVPEYTSLTVEAGATLEALPWSGQIGGLLAFVASEFVRVEGRVHAEAAGFRGAETVPGDAIRWCTELDEAPPRGAAAGEGLNVAFYGTAHTGRGNRSIGGGGGVCFKSGGGGGGHGGAGGQGGITDNWDHHRDVGGLGGVAVDRSTRVLVMGGGGGNGHASNEDAGDGGGAILISSPQFSFGPEGSIEANGATPVTPHERGGPGGGAGGTILLNAAEPPDTCPTLSARGGDGANSKSHDVHPYGPGAGGGGGVVVMPDTWSCAADVAGGIAGLYYPSGQMENGSGMGARDGEPGMLRAGPAL